MGLITKYFTRFSARSARSYCTYVSSIQLSSARHRDDGQETNCFQRSCRQMRRYTKVFLTRATCATTAARAFHIHYVQTFQDVMNRQCWNVRINQTATRNLERSFYGVLVFVFPLRQFYTEQMFSFGERAITPPCRHTTSAALKVYLCDIYTIFNFECWKCARMRFHCANGLVVLCSCAPWREHCLVYCGSSAQGAWTRATQRVILS